MRKIILSLVLALCMASHCFALSPGFYEVKENLNVHSTPNFGNNKIDYYSQGSVINVLEIKEDWCRVSHPKYTDAYVYCRYLQPTDKDYIIPLRSPTEMKKMFRDMQLTSSDQMLQKTFIGTKITRLDTNVRSTPRLGNNRIGYVKKGTSVEVTAVEGDWCKVKYKNFESAYLYCSLLGLSNADLQARIRSHYTSLEKPKPKFSVAAKTLSDLYDWTMDNNEAGRLYINNSGKIALEKAKAWQADAVRAGFEFDFPRKDKGYCVHNFISASDPNNVFQYTCAEVGSEGSSKIVPKSEVAYVTDEISSNFNVPFAAVVTKMIDGNGKIWPLLQEYFRESKKIQMEFTLSTEKNSTFWTVKVYDENGSMIKLRLDGTDPGATFFIFEGNIKNEGKN